MTSPHFLFAPHYLEYVEGLDPNEEEHCTPLVYEPVVIIFAAAIVDIGLCGIIFAEYRNHIES